jgi:hypothetical protein
MSTPTAAKKTAKTAPAKKAATRSTAPKKAPAKKAAAKAKPAAAPEVDAVTEYAELYRAWFAGRNEAAAQGPMKPAVMAARVQLCTLAGCTEPGPGHRLDSCEIKTEITALMHAIRRDSVPGLGMRDRTGAAAAVLIHRLTELTAA